MAGDKIFASWYNNIYNTLTTTLPANGISVSVTKKTVTAGNQARASELNSLITDLNNIKGTTYLRHTTNCADGLTTATAGTTKIIDQTKIDNYINEIARFCGNQTITFSQVFAGGRSAGSGNNRSTCSKRCGDNNRSNFVCSKSASFSAFQGSSKSEQGFFTNNNFSGFATSPYGRFSQSFSDDSNFRAGRSFTNFTQRDVTNFSVLSDGGVVTP